MIDQTPDGQTQLTERFYLHGTSGFGWPFVGISESMLEGRGAGGIPVWQGCKLSCEIVPALVWSLDAHLGVRVSLSIQKLATVVQVACPNLTTAG